MSVQEVQCGSTCKWLPSGTRMTKWFCSSALLRTSPSSSSRSKMKPQKVSVSGEAGALTERRHQYLSFWRLFLGNGWFVFRKFTVEFENERENDVQVFDGFENLIFPVHDVQLSATRKDYLFLFCCTVSGEREQYGGWHVTTFVSGKQTSLM